MNNDIQINILIIDDKSSKIKVLKRVLTKFIDKGILDANIFPEKGDIDTLSEKISEYAENRSMSELQEYIKIHIIKNNIDILILDFALTDDESKVKDSRDTSGYKILDFLHLNKDARLKYLPVVSYSIMPIDKIEGDPTSNIIAHINKENNDTDLEESLGDDLKDKNMKAILSKIRHFATIYSLQKIEQYDLAIICALQSELDYILKLKKPQDWKIKAIGNEKEMHKTIFTNKKGKELKVIAVTEDIMGMSEAASLTTRIIEQYRPKYIAMTGICGGIQRNSTNLGDIVIPNSIWNWQAGKLDSVTESSNENKDEEETVYESVFKRSPKYLNMSHFDAKLNKLNETFKTDIIKNFKNIAIKLNEEREEDNKVETPSKINILKGPMVSGSAVVADISIVDKEITSSDRKIGGIDMEAYGVAYASRNVPEEYRPKALVIKSVCDFADSDKGDTYHDFCSYASAQALYKLFTEYIDIDEN